MYRIIMSKHPSPCKRPPPIFGRELQAPTSTYTGQYGTVKVRQSSTYTSTCTYTTHLTRSVVKFGDKHAVVAARRDQEEVLDRLRVLIIGGSIPEDDTVLNFVRLAKGVHQRVGEVAPLHWRLRYSMRRIFAKGGGSTHEAPPIPPPTW